MMLLLIMEVLSNSFWRQSLLKPEIKTEYEAGVELSFFNRLDLGVTYYANQIKDNLVQADVNPSSSFLLVMAILPKLKIKV
jgi:outer membrane receptor protein involved in Fe transport